MSPNVMERRALAYLLDICIVWAVMGPLVFGARALGISAPPTGPGVWLAAVVTFSIPCWIYFTLSDAAARGATLGKRVLGVRVATMEGGRVPPPRALLRTAIKLLPWELTHVSWLLLAPELGAFTPLQTVGMSISSLLTVSYIAVAILTRGERAPHDYVARTHVVRASATSLATPVPA